MTKQFIDMPTALLMEERNISRMKRDQWLRGSLERNKAIVSKEWRPRKDFVALNLTQMQNSSPYFVTLCLPRFEKGICECMYVCVYVQEYNEACMWQ